MQRFLRSWHRRLSILIAIPFFITVFTGVLMMTRSFNPLIVPPVPETSAQLKLGYDEVLRIAQTAPDAGVQRFADISQINAQPKTGLIRVRTKNKYEIVINGETGELLASGPRPMSWLVDLHEGAFFGDWVRYGIFLPMGVIVFFLLVSGTIIYIIGWRNKRRLR